MKSGRDRILAFIRTNQISRPIDLVRHLGLSRVRIHALLLDLVVRGILSKHGQSPRVYYSLAKQKSAPDDSPTELKEAIDKTYLYVDPVGEMVEGWLGFEQWIREIGQTNKLEKLAREYIKQRKSIDNLINSLGIIDATGKFKQSFDGKWLDRVFYKDAYSLPSFGKTRLGQMVLYAKQSQNRELIKQVADICRDSIFKIINKYKVGAVAFIPPTVPRNIQFIHELRQYLELKLPAIKLSKSYSGKILVAQKTLSRFSERVTNARETIMVVDKNLEFDTVLLIDDAVGSGATLNETAKKLKERRIAKKVIGFAVVGSMKGFEVIREV